MDVLPQPVGNAIDFKINGKAVVIHISDIAITHKMYGWAFAYFIRIS